MIRQITKQDIPECVEVIRASFLTVGKEFNITPENAPLFTAYATDEAKVNFWMDEQKRPMYGYFENGKLRLDLDPMKMMDDDMLKNMTAIDYDNVTQVFFFDVDDYNALTGNSESLASGTELSAAAITSFALL